MKDFIIKYKFNIIFYLCTIASLYVNFVIFYASINNSLISFNATGPILYTLVNCIIFSIPYFFCKKRFGAFILIYLLIIDLLLISNVVYFRFYKNIIPFFSYFQLENVIDISSTLPSYLKISDFVYLLSTICLFLLYIFYFKKKIKTTSRKLRAITSSILILFCSALFASSLVSAKIQGISLDDKFYLRRTNQPAFTSYYGLIAGWTYQISDHLYTDRKDITQTELELIKEYNFLNSRYTSENSTGIFDKNLILILVESLDSWILKFDDGKAVPFLTELASDENVILIPHVLSQVSHGRSSDAQLIINTGLLPVFNNVVVNFYSTQYYPSLAECWQDIGTSSYTIMGNEAYFWNQQTMNYAYHIENLISREMLDDNEIIGYGISDKSLFRQTSSILSNIKDYPFYAQILTLSSHDAPDFAGYETELVFPQNFIEKSKNYIKSMEYVDSALKEFIEDLKVNVLYENSVIVITGDHTSPTMDDMKDIAFSGLTEYEKENDFAGFTPLYIINSGLSFQQKENQVIGQIDIYPTLLDIIGVSDDCWKGLGTSIFSEKPPTFAVDKNLNVIGDTTAYTKEEIQHKIKAWTISDLIIRKKYFEVIKDKTKYYE